MMRQQHASRTNRRGSVLVLAAFLMVVILGMVAFTVDWGYIAFTKTQLQNAADAAARAAAVAISDGPLAVRTAAERVATANHADRNPVTLVPAEDVELGQWDQETATFTPLSADKESDANAVRVTCTLSEARGNQLNLFFAPVLGIQFVDVRASAIAMRSTGSCGGIIGLNRVYLREQTFTDSYDSQLGPYVAGSAGDAGDVCSNGHIRLIGSAGINGDAHPGPEEDGVDFNGDTYVTGDQTVLDRIIDYPPIKVRDAATNNNNDQIPQTNNGADAFNGGGHFILSGVFGRGHTLPSQPSFRFPADTQHPQFPGLLASTSQTVLRELVMARFFYFGGNKNNNNNKNSGGGSGGSGGDTIDLPPGTYYFESLILRNGSLINISGPTIIYVKGIVDLSDGGIVNQTQIPKNLQLYPMGTQTWLPENVDFHGVIYSTTSAVEKKGGAAQFFGKLIGQKVKISGSGGLHVDQSIYFPDLTSGGPELSAPSTGSVLVQ